MARSIRISEEAARTALAWMGQSRVPAAVKASEELRGELKRLELPPSLADYDRMKTPGSERPAAMRRSPKVSHKSRRPSKEEKREETAKLWRIALSRSGGTCECGCGRVFQEEGDCKPEMDHEASRRVPQTPTNVWMLAMVCHRQRQGNRPSEEYWLRNFLRHCQKHDYMQEAKRVEDRIAVVAVKSGLPASPRVGP